jgi:hypothetical protein
VCFRCGVLNQGIKVIKQLMSQPNWNSPLPLIRSLLKN